VEPRPQDAKYRERFRGVTMAFTDIARGRLHPMRIIELAPTAHANPDPLTSRGPSAQPISTDDRRSVGEGPVPAT